MRIGLTPLKISLIRITFLLYIILSYYFSNLLSRGRKTSYMYDQLRKI